MRRSSWRGLAALSALLVACADPASPTLTFPLAFFWMEWPTAVTQAAPGSMLFQSYRDFCFEPSIGFTVNTSVITVHSQAIAHDQVCPLREDAIPAFPTDTLVPLPVLVPAFGMPSFFSVQATLYGLRGESFERAAGTIVLSDQADPMRQMTGNAMMLTDSAGCIVLRGGVPRLPLPGGGLPHEYAIQNPPAFRDTIEVFVRAHQVTGAMAPACGTKPLAHLDYVETVLLP